MRNNILFILTILGIIATYVICYQLYTESLRTAVYEMEQQVFTLEVRNENDLLNINNK